MDTAILFIAFVVALLFGWGVFGGFVKLAVALILWMMIGNVAGYIIRGEGYGVAGNIALGLIGGIFGTLLFGMFGLGGVAQIPLLGSFVTGLVGAVLIINLVHWIGDQ